MIHRISHVAFACLALTAPTLATNPSGLGQTWYVAAGADPSVADGSAALPYASIQLAITVAADGDTIAIGPGTFAEFDIAVDRRLTIRGAGKDATIIDAQSQGRGFQFQPGALTFAVKDLTITHARSGDSAYGGAMHVNNVLWGEVRNVRFLDNVAGRSGGAMFIRGATAGLTMTIDRCEFIGNEALGVNHAGQGGAIWSGFNTANVLVINSLFDGNSSEANGVAVNAQNAGVACDFVNCTFVNHALASAGSDQLISAAASATLRLYNSIFATNGASRLSGEGGDSAVRHCLIGSMTLQQMGDLFANDTGTPTFVDAANGDYRLDAGSLGIDAGDGTIILLNGVETDLRGAPRWIDDPTADTGVGAAVPWIDLGCYERQPQGTFSWLGGECATAAGAPPAFGMTSGAPSIGQGLDLFVYSPSSASAFVGVGFGQIGGPAGIDLAVLGAPGCVLHSDLAIVLSANPDGNEVTLAVPMDHGLLGVPFYTQGVVIHPGSNALGLALTNAYRGVFGDS